MNPRSLGLKIGIVNGHARAIRFDQVATSRIASERRKDLTTGALQTNQDS